MTTLIGLLLALSLAAQEEEGAVPKQVEERVVEGDVAPKADAPYPREAISAAVKREAPRIRACYERRLKEAPALEGKMTARFRIEPDGRVSAAHIVEKTLEDDELERCVTSVMLELDLPPSPNGGLVSVAYPFVFRVEDVPLPQEPEQKGVLDELLGLFGCG